MSLSAWSGFSAPLAGGGAYALYGPPPWYFEGFSASVFLAFNPSDLADLLPPPLKFAGDPVCRLSLHDLICDYGLGERFMQEQPDQAHFGEAVLAVQVEHEGMLGQWCPFLWCTTDAEFAVGRELYGWQQRLGEMSLTRPPLRRSWRPGDVVTGLVTRGRRAVFNFSITLERAGDVPPVMDGLRLYPDQAKANNHFTETVLYRPIQREIQRTLLVSAMEETCVENIWSGSANVQITAPELAALKNTKVLGGRWHDLSWKKPWPSRVIREDLAKS